MIVLILILMINCPSRIFSVEDIWGPNNGEPFQNTTTNENMTRGFYDEESDDALTGVKRGAPISEGWLLLIFSSAIYGVYQYRQGRKKRFK